MVIKRCIVVGCLILFIGCASFLRLVSDAFNPSKTIRVSIVGNCDHAYIAFTTLPSTNQPTSSPYNFLDNISAEKRLPFTGSTSLSPNETFYFKLLFMENGDSAVVNIFVDDKLTKTYRAANNVAPFYMQYSLPR